MEAIECITTRKSIRKFLDQPVSKELIMEVIRTAQQSPSYKNSQPWEVAVVSGAKKEGLSTLMIDLLTADQPPCPDLPAPSSWPEAEGDRIKDLLRMRKEATGIDLGDPAIIKKAKKANFSFYGAPLAVYLYQDSSLSEWSLFDLGLFAQSLMLAAHGKGLGSVPQAFATDYSAQVKEYLGIPATKRLVLGLSMGYPDMDSSLNKLTTSRSPVEEISTWIE
ncbi:MAG: nitroreductase family protein [Desulfobulbaceae bacterium]|uniref:Nitroreductase family protein n=1 Tax=Candidatus Desulfatifera sulfidica TaxID=2841691 RepID=A0A8J6T9T5_9BACT|nr:nitroreductase family protein [Candidatus Desulfatifera sulfidica]